MSKSVFFFARGCHIEDVETRRMENEWTKTTGSRWIPVEEPKEHDEWKTADED